MKSLIFAALFLPSCALRVGMQPGLKISEGKYPPVARPARMLCLPCFEFEGFSIGLMFFGGWPVLFYLGD